MQDIGAVDTEDTVPDDEFDHEKATCSVLEL